MNAGETAERGAHEPRVNAAQAAPAAYRAMLALEGAVQGSGLEGSLIELVKLRASYLNGCAYCVDMHTKDARHAGETEQRLYAVPVWRESPFYSPRERAALLWTEEVTNVGATGVTDAAYEAVRQQFSDEELVWLTLAVVAINGWNRLAVSFRTPVGGHVAG